MEPIKKLGSAVLLLSLVAYSSAQTGVNFDRGTDIKTAIQAFKLDNDSPLPTQAFADSLPSRADTSGCSVQNGSQRAGPVVVTIYQAPWKSCWNFNDNWVAVEYKWAQRNNGAPQKSNIGFWMSLNNVAQYQKATSYTCKPVAPSLSYGADTSGNTDTDYICSALASFGYRASPNLWTYAYNQNGNLNAWDIQVAVSLDDNGNWDSMGGKNYSFRFK